MLKPGALSIKASKKKWFLRIAQWLRWYGGVRWHATNEDEVTEIKSHFGSRSEIILAPNLSQRYETPVKMISKSPGMMKLVCVARISPEKGILEAIQFLSAAQLHGLVSCDFIGTMQDEEYLERCRVAAENSGVDIHFKGEMTHHKVAACLPDYHFFYLTTWGENFGHAIAEALQLGLPVIISNRTPWRNLAEAGVGYDLPLEEGAFAGALRTALNIGQLEFDKTRILASQYGRLKANDQKTYDQCRLLFAP
jgi:glycosyltransferase involved in cell wall biosynthesis